MKIWLVIITIELVRNIIVSLKPQGIRSTYKVANSTYYPTSYFDTQKEQLKVSTLLFWRFGYEVHFHMRIENKRSSSDLIFLLAKYQSNEYKVQFD